MSSETPAFQDSDLRQPSPTHHPKHWVPAFAWMSGIVNGLA
jgi:hypothetical protein